MGRIERRDAGPRIGDGWGPGVSSVAESVAQAWESFALIALRLPGL